MAEQALRRMTADEFLTWEAEQQDDNTYELCDGQIVVKDGEPMLVGGLTILASAPSPEHQEIAANILRLFARRLGGPCRAIGQPKVPLPNRADAYYRPDIAVTCVPGPHGQASPTVFIEVLSRSTRDYDRGTKLEEYQGMESVAEILLVASERRSVRLWQRDGVRWIVQDFIGSSVVPLPGIGSELPLDEVYEGLEL